LRLDTLFLDAGGVLLHPNWERVSETLGRHGIHVDPLVLARAEPYAKRDLDVPLHAMDDESRGRLYFKLVLGRAGVSSPEAAARALEELRDYHARNNLWESVPEDVPHSLERLRAKGLHLVVVSNANGTLRTQLAKANLLKHLDHVLDSFEEGVEKPDPRIFLIALERCGAKPENVLHVGDLYNVDVVGARAAGLRAALLDPLGLYRNRDCETFASLGGFVDSLT
jgi:HAD superfamily hydrolase (TIGR01549 family)